MSFQYQFAGYVSRLTEPSELLAGLTEKHSPLQHVSSKDLVMAKRRIIVWTEYMKYRAKLRGFDLARIEEIVRYSSERYRDMATGRRVVIGHHGKRLVVIPYEMDEDSITPITIHATTRQQINFRLRTGRYSHE